MHDATGKIVVCDNVARIRCNRCGFREFRISERCFECKNIFSESLTEKRDDLNEIFRKYL